MQWSEAYRNQALMNGQIRTAAPPRAPAAPALQIARPVPELRGRAPSAAGAAPSPAPLPLEYEGEPEGEEASPRVTSLDSQESSDISSPCTALKDFDRFWHEKNTVEALSDDPLLDEQSQSARFRHGSWWKVRRHVWEAMVRTSQRSQRRAAFGACGSFSFIEQSDTDATKFRMRCNHCKDRLCTPCATARAARIASRVLGLLPAGQNTVSFMTFTLCGKGEPLGQLIDRLYAAFKALRRHPLWEEKVSAGVAFLEVKWSDKAQRWHPHLHVIALAKYIPQGEMSDVWRGITHDSFIVDIQRVQNAERCGRYVCKYASKPLNSSFSNTPALLDEAMRALKGRRLAFKFGKWYGEPILGTDDEDFEHLDKVTYHFYSPLHDLLEKANSGDPESINTLRLAGIDNVWRLNCLEIPPPVP